MRRTVSLINAATDRTSAGCVARVNEFDQNSHEPGLVFDKAAQSPAPTLMRVLYVCPFAALTGHPPFESTKETRILRESGVEVELLTFCGVHAGFDVVVSQRQVMPDNALFRMMRQRLFPQWLLRVFEYTATVVKAAMIAGERPIYLRDAEPFPHVVHLVNVVFRRRWVVSATGGLFTTGDTVSPTLKKALRTTTVFWPKWYRLGRDRIHYSVQNQAVKDVMSKLVGNNVSVVPLGHREEKATDRKVARRELRVADNETMLLVFGVAHSGKDSATVFAALDGVKNVVLYHAGASKQSLGDRPSDLAVRHQGAKSTVLDRYVTENEKRLLFGAADWLVMSYNANFKSATSMLWEAAAFGVPVIASDGNELGTLVARWNMGLVFQAGDAENLRTKVLATTSPECPREVYTAGCRNFTQFYSEERWCQETLELLRKL